LGDINNQAVEFSVGGQECRNIGLAVPYCCIDRRVAQTQCYQPGVVEPSCRTRRCMRLEHPAQREHFVDLCVRPVSDEYPLRA